MNLAEPKANFKNQKKFAKIYIEISNLCNLQCSFCPEVLREKKILGLENFKKIISEVTPFTDKITMHLMGEPLLHPQFLEFLEVVNASPIKLELTTNGILLRKMQSKLLQTAALRQINFSLQSYIDNFPGKNIENYLAPILDFTQTAVIERPDLFINYRLWNLGESTLIPENLRDLLAQLSKPFQFQQPDSIDVRSQKSWKLTDKVRVHWDTRFEWPSLEAPVGEKHGFCYGLKSQIGIHADGTVVPCCLDKEAIINLGNLFETPLPLILESKRAQKIVKEFERGQVYEELCQKCTFKDRFKNKLKINSK